MLYASWLWTETDLEQVQLVGPAVVVGGLAGAGPAVAVPGLPDLGEDVAAAAGEVAGRVLARCVTVVGAGVVASGGAVPALPELAGAEGVEGWDLGHGCSVVVLPHVGPDPRGGVGGHLVVPKLRGHDW